jgi:hypothetical protein
MSEDERVIRELVATGMAASIAGDLRTRIARDANVLTRTS